MVKALCYLLISSFLASYFLAYYILPVNTTTCIFCCVLLPGLKIIIYHYCIWLLKLDNQLFVCYLIKVMFLDKFAKVSKVLTLYIYESYVSVNLYVSN